jgi:hypothetical protein
LKKPGRTACRNDGFALVCKHQIEPEKSTRHLDFHPPAYWFSPATGTTPIVLYDSRFMMPQLRAVTSTAFASATAPRT